MNAGYFFYGAPGFFPEREDSADPCDAFTVRYCEICSAEMGTMTKAALEASGRDCGCRPDGW